MRDMNFNMEIGNISLRTTNYSSRLNIEEKENWKIIKEAFKEYLFNPKWENDYKKNTRDTQNFQMQVGSIYLTTWNLYNNITTYDIEDWQLVKKKFENYLEKNLENN